MQYIYVLYMLTFIYLFIYYLFNLGRPFSEILFIKGAQETRKHGRLLCEPETPG